MNARRRIRVPLPTALLMIGTYAKARLLEQIRVVAFIILYLVAFQTVVLGTPPANAAQIAIGIAMVILGLTLFLEGVFLGMMPLGERVGVRLPERTGILAIAVFGTLVGVGSTLAEPAVASLRALGETVAAWEAPLLFGLLERYTDTLLLSIGIGVGIAVALGLTRFRYGVSIKPFIFVLIPILLAVSVVAELNDKLSSIVGLAWDSGAVTTGAVTVPLVLALGVGVSRASGTDRPGASGFGIVTLASAVPILCVFILGLAVAPDVPEPMEETAFFGPEHRSEAMRLFDSEGELMRHAFTRGTEAGRRAFFEEAGEYEAAIAGLVRDEGARRRLLGDMSLSVWLETVASRAELERFPSDIRRYSRGGDESAPDYLGTITSEAQSALRAVLPLTVLLLVVMLVILRDRPRFIDEVALGIGLAVVGMTLLSAGIALGLVPLGRDVGGQLPRAFQTDSEQVGEVVIENFDPDIVFESIGEDGDQQSYFYLHGNGSVDLVEFESRRYDADSGVYRHVVSRPPLFGPNLTLLGIGLVFLFAFGMGYGSTRAEPALNALGTSVEKLTVGTIERSSVVHVVALGVGIGLLAGVARILYGVPTTWLLLPPYMLLIPLTFMSEESFAAVAWDTGGVTTGTVTVPLVLAMGLSIGGELGVVDGFGVLALASVFPVLSVLIHGLMVQRRERRTIRATGEEDRDE